MKLASFVLCIVSLAYASKRPHDTQEAEIQLSKSPKLEPAPEILEKGEVFKSPNDPQSYRHLTLSNGLTAVLISDSETNTVIMFLHLIHPMIRVKRQLVLAQVTWIIHARYRDWPILWNT